MAMRFIRKVRTASGAVAVQIVNRTGRTVTSIEHIGSAHTNAELGILLAKAERELRPGQQVFDFGDVEQLPVRTSDVADWREPESRPKSTADAPRASPPQAKSSLHQQSSFGRFSKRLTTGWDSTSWTMLRSRPWCWRG